MIAQKGLRMNKNIITFLSNKSIDGFISHSACKTASHRFNIDLKKLEDLALKNGITPLRYKRNKNSISTSHQLKLTHAHVAIIGCGGLGGYICENLSRIGVGKISIFDHDIFEEHNINRQRFSSYETLGLPKVKVVKTECQKMNPVCEIESFEHRFDPTKDMELLENVDIVIDALDSPALKSTLAKVCFDTNIAFIHAAIGGFTTQHSSCCTLEKLYKDGSNGAESHDGNLSFMAAYAAAIQSCECVKILLGMGEDLNGNILMTDLLNNEFILL